MWGPKGTTLRLISCPMHQKGGKTNKKNYRPISQLSGFSKILEKHRFRNHKSTETAIFNFVSESLIAINQKKHELVIFLGLIYVLDMTDHCLLLKILEYIGLMGLTHEWVMYMNG
ncbi:uncharacterized protein LOC126456569 [Schistocerca serialis cubense]|uniref:uncharacterized protein LOC126456569 n=1 Tax=Schistocerca serialis cubense TaxID=2023355 RepID=UPI00214E3718|nr:uncharacterized protein LOC126456569 [Schistocerca serialis cubense]